MMLTCPIFLARRMREFTSQLGPVKLAWRNQGGYTPLVQADCSPAPNGAVFCCIPPPFSITICASVSEQKNLSI